MAVLRFVELVGELLGLRIRGLIGYWSLKERIDNIYVWGDKD